MSNESLITLINNASRPFKSFKLQFGDREFEFKTRTLSSIETDTLQKSFTEKFDEISREMEEGNVDVAIIKRGLQRQSKEALSKLVVKADRVDFLNEASTELDDLPFNDERVQALANEKQETAFKLLMGASDEEVLEKALERRAFVTATIKATDAQNRQFIYLSVYKADETRAFNSADEIEEMDRETMSLFINTIHSVLRGSYNTNPLKSRAKRGSAKRSSSPKSLEAV